MLEYVYRYNIQFDKGGAYRDWLGANDQALSEHQPPGWTYLGTWFSVRAFGEFGCESRFQLEDYESLGSGFGDDESQRLGRELFEQFIDWSTKPRGSALSNRGRGAHRARTVASPVDLRIGGVPVEFQA